MKTFKVNPDNLIAYLKQTAQQMREHGCKLRRHPYEFVVEFGMFCKPKPRPKGIGRGIEQECFNNSLKLMSVRKGFTYVEGYALASGISSVWPVHHAWCMDANQNVIDVTWDKPGLLYLGIPFDEQYTILRALERKFPLLDVAYGGMELLNSTSDEFFNKKWKESRASTGNYSRVSST